MKKNEIIELNGKEYTLELNRDSFIQIDKLTNIQKSINIVKKDLYEYMDETELDDNFNPDLLKVDDNKLEEEIKLKEQTIHKIIERAFYIWLYPNHHLTITEVKELLQPYFDDEEKSSWIGEKYSEYLQKCVEIRSEYNEELKNLKAQVNKEK